MFDIIEKLPLADLQAYTTPVIDENVIESWRISCNVGFSLKEYPTEESIEKILYLTLSFNTKGVGDDQLSLFSNEIETSFKEWHHILLTSKSTEEFNARMELQQNFFVQRIATDHPLCTTSKSYLAAVLPTAKEGDCLALLAVGDYSLILRPTGYHYRLIGPCYIHGIMDGEAFPDDLDQLTWFSIM